MFGRKCKINLSEWSHGLLQFRSIYLVEVDKAFCNVQSCLFLKNIVRLSTRKYFKARNVLIISYNIQLLNFLEVKDENSKKLITNLYFQCQAIYFCAKKCEITKKHKK